MNVYRVNYHYIAQPPGTLPQINSSATECFAAKDIEDLLVQLDAYCKSIQRVKTKVIYIKYEGKLVNCPSPSCHT